MVGEDQIRSDTRKTISTSYTYKKFDEHVYFWNKIETPAAYVNI
jgi:hypothetical protein